MTHFYILQPPPSPLSPIHLHLQIGTTKDEEPGFEELKQEITDEKVRTERFHCNIQTFEKKKLKEGF